MENFPKILKKSPKLRENKSGPNHDGVASSYFKNIQHTRKFEHLDTHSEILLRSQWFETHCDLLNITEFFKLLILLIFSVILTVSSNLGSHPVQSSRRTVH